jgi:hypothetical protein
MSPLHTLTPVPFISILILSSHLRLGLVNGPFPSELLTKVLSSLLNSPSVLLLRHMPRPPHHAWKIPYAYRKRDINFFKCDKYKILQVNVLKVCCLCTVQRGSTNVWLVRHCLWQVAVCRKSWLDVYHRQCYFHRSSDCYINQTGHSRFALCHPNKLPVFYFYCTYLILLY